MAVPYELLTAVRAELRAWSGHWARGTVPRGRDLTTHDARMPDGSCLSCALIEELDVLLTTPDPPRPADVVDMGARRRRPGLTTGGLFRVEGRGKDGRLVPVEQPEPAP